MFKTKGAMLGIAAVLAGTALLLGGMAINSTAGAATDGTGGFPAGLPDPLGDNGTTDPGEGAPPASPIEPTNPGDPGLGGTPGTDPLGGAGAGGTAPGGLPDAGFGEPSDGDSGMILLGLAAMALTGAGLATAGAARRK
jgi:hypothetical protein